ncbi:RNA methyltransferase [bacterium]|nr:RNA methyltransferase [bacterium]
MWITSLSNARVKQIRKLRDRKERQETGLFYIEGLRIVTEAVQKNAPIELLITAPELLTSEFGQELAISQVKRGVQVLELSAEVFKGLALKDGPQGMAAVVRQNWLPLARITPTIGEDWVALHEVADPGNLGTILRTHDAVAGAGVILLDHCTDPYDPTSIRASMGAIFSQRIVKTTYEDFAEWKKASGMALVGTSDKAESDYHAYKYPTPLTLLMGSERQGLSDDLWKLCDGVVSIPMIGSSDSLNLSVATGVVLYEIFNQRRGSHGSGGGL